jgi:hypothetical protein
MVARAFSHHTIRCRRNQDSIVGLARCQRLCAQLFHSISAGFSTTGRQSFGRSIKASRPVSIFTFRLRPLPNRLVRHGDAPLSEEIFGIAEAQTEPVVEPDS